MKEEKKLQKVDKKKNGKIILGKQTSKTKIKLLLLPNKREKCLYRLSITRFYNNNNSTIICARQFAAIETDYETSQAIVRPTNSPFSYIAHVRNSTQNNSFCFTTTTIALGSS